MPACRKKEGSSADSKTIDWWHIQNTDPMLSVWAGLARDFEAAHPGVKVNIKGNLLLSLSALATLRDTGLHDRIIPVAGLEWSF